MLDYYHLVGLHSDYTFEKMLCGGMGMSMTYTCILLFHNFLCAAVAPLESSMKELLKNLKEKEATQNWREDNDQVSLIVIKLNVR